MATSSASMPSMVARMLAALEVDDMEGRVLEIGTGTGWNAALLAHRVGDRRVATVEIDPVLAEQAQDALLAVGRAPLVVCEDGMAGYPQGGPYDRVIATCSVARVPWAWVEQTAPGGRIVVPLHRDVWAGGLIALTVGGNGQAAVGRWIGEAWFMPARADRLSPAPVDSATGRSSATGLDPARLVTPGFGAYAYARLPDVTLTHAAEGGGQRVWLTGRDGSAATAAGAPNDREFEVWQYGPDNLWDRAEAAWTEYLSQGCPPLENFGLTVTPDRQQVWLRTPGNVIG
ncbi:methyltransferase domain-containing protein [Streptomyces macrosporus]